MRILFLLFIMIFISCKNGNDKSCSLYSKIAIVNKASNKKHIEIKAFQDTLIDMLLLPSQKLSRRQLCFDNIPKIDGSFSIHVNGGKLDSISQFGYFSNGIPEETWYQIIIYDNSFKVIQHPSTDKF